MAEHPGVMNPDDYDLAGFVVGVVDRPKMIGPDKVKVGDVILGLPSSGIHSNGYSLVRKVAIEGKTVEELERGYDELTRRFYSFGSMWRRLSLHRSLPAFGPMNFGFRSALGRKVADA